MSKYYNKRITVREHTRFDPRIKKRVSVGQYPRNQRYRFYQTISQVKASNLFSQRSERAKAMDLSKTSKKTFEEPNEFWEKNIGKSDVKGIDTKPKPFNFSEVINEKTKPKFKQIKKYNDHPDIKLEYGFAISKFGSVSGKREESIMIGKEGSIDASNQGFREFKDSLKYVIHSHPDLVDKGVKTFANHFSLEDLISIGTFGEIPGLIYHEYSREIIDGKPKEFDTYYLKMGTGVLKDRSKIIEEYGGIFKEYEKKEKEWDRKWNAKNDPYYFLNMSNEDYEKSQNEHNTLVNRYVSKVEKYEDKYKFQTKKLFKHKYKLPKPKSLAKI